MEVCALQHGTTQVRALKLRFLQIGARQLGKSEICPLKLGSSEMRFLRLARRRPAFCIFAAMKLAP